MSDGQQDRRSESAGQASAGARARWKRMLPATRTPSGRRTNLSSIDTDYIARSLLLEERQPSKPARTAIWVAGLAVVTLIVWMTFATLDERVVAQGTILPQEAIRSVQHLEGGIVAAVHVSNGDYVELGEPLLVLSETTPKSQLNTLNARLSALDYQIEQLRAFAAGRRPDFARPSPDMMTVASVQGWILDTKFAARDAQIQVLNKQILARKKEIDGLRQEEIALEKQIRIQSEELKLREDLLKKGLMAKLSVLETQQEYIGLTGRHAQTVAEIARTENQIAETKGRIIELQERLRADALEQLGKLTAERAEVGSDLTALKDRVDRLSIPAPISGVVSNMAPIARGNVITPGQILMDIVPDKTGLIAEVSISPKDIGRVAAGMDSLLRIETFDYAKHGSVRAHVDYVSASTFKNESGQPFFRAHLYLAKDHVGLDPDANRITPGMSLSAEIKAGERTLLAYLLKPITRSLEGAFSER